MAALRELVFVAARGQNVFFGELAEALRHELKRLGIETEVSNDAFPGLEQGRVNVLLAPHEYAALAPPGAAPTSGALARTITVCTEQPGTPWFTLGSRFAAASGAVFDINRRGVRELESLGVSATYMQLGYSELWDRGAGGEREVEICFLGGASHRRRRALAVFGSELWRHRCRLILSDNARPSTDSGPSFVAGGAKLDLLSRSRILLNIHRDDRPYFEWQRILEAIHCGAVVVSEHSTDYDPLVPGEHFLSGELYSLQHVAAHALTDENRRREMADAALGLIREQIPMRSAAEQLAAAAESLLTSPRSRLPRRTPGIGAAMPETPLRELVRPLRRRRDGDDSAVRASLKRSRLEAMKMERRVKALERGLSGTEIETDLESPAYARVTPRVSVVVPLYNQGGAVVEALDSVAASRYPDLELLVVDDGSTDDSRRIAREWIDTHAEVPTVLFYQPVNRGLPATRNAAIEQARGELLLPLDSDNVLYPSCIERLVEALEADPDAAFAYGILELFTEDGPFSINGYWGWEPDRLLSDNYIDALALIRRDVLDQLGGYTTDPRLHGLEDFELWLRIAKLGKRAAHVPEIVARYREEKGSMLGLTGLSRDDAREALRELEPRFIGVGWEKIDELAKD